MIAQFKLSSGWPVLAVILVALLGCVSLTDAKRDRASTVIASNGSRTSASASETPDGTYGQLMVQKSPADKLGRWVASVDSCPSPDGRYLSYVNWAHGNLAVCDTRTGELRDLTSEGTWEAPDQFAWRSVWSPDSKQVAYIWYKGDNCDLRVVARAGGATRVLVPHEKGGNIHPQHWSRDGRFIIGLAPIKKWPEGAKNFRQIVRVEVSSGVVQVVKELPGATDGVNLALSPDGRHIAYDFPPDQLHVVSIDGTTERRFIDHPAKHRNPLWMPDGKHVVFLSDRSGANALWVQAVSGGQPVGEPRMVRDGFQGARLLGFSDEGALHYTARTPRINVFVANVDFDAATMETPQLVSLRNDGRNRNPRWSADGSQLAYVSRTNSGTQIATLVFRDTATGNERILENSVMNEFGDSPRWSPDLSKLAAPAYGSGPDNRNLAYYSVDVKSAQRSIVFSGKQADSGNFTRDGTSHIFRHHLWEGQKPAGCAFVERNLQSGQERLIVRRDNDGFNSPMHLSPGDDKLAYCEVPYSPKKEGKTSLLLTARADGVTQVVWEQAEGRVTVLDWLPDNRRVLVVVEDRKGTQQLHAVDTILKSARAFGPPFPRNDPIQHLSVHPDGKRIAFSRGDVVVEIWTMKNIVPPTDVAAK